MHDLPHHYTVNALARASGAVTLRATELEDIASTAPPEFGGPPGHWSPETLLMASVADCVVLSFRAVATASRLEWLDIDCNATGTLDRADGGMRFTRIDVSVRLQVPAGSDIARVERLLDKAKRSCLISNSLNAEIHLEAEISQGGSAETG